MSGMKTPSSFFWSVYPQQTGLPTGFYSRILKYKDNILLPVNFYKKNYISGKVKSEYFERV